MTWIDERLFGWSRSAKHGTSAWYGFSGDEASRIGTPDETDDEDTGDYDNVVGIVASNEESGFKSKSRQSSYADLQRLRQSHMAFTSVKGDLSASAHEAPLEAIDDLHNPDRHRKRRESLTDNVDVKRIAAIEPEKEFCHATQNLNSEILAHKKRHD